MDAKGFKMNLDVNLVENLTSLFDVALPPVDNTTSVMQLHSLVLFLVR